MNQNLFALQKELEALPPLDAHRARRRERAFVADFICSSSQLAGIMVSREETGKVMYGRLSHGSATIPEQIDLQHYYRAYENMRKFLGTGWKMGASEIEQLHAQLTIMPGDRAAYRDEYMGLPYYLGSTREQLHHLVDEHNNDWLEMMPVHRAALFHLYFDALHPFKCRNMRLARLILNFHLMHAGFPPINIGFLEKRKYHACIKEFREYDNALPMFRFIEKHVRAALLDEKRARLQHGQRPDTGGVALWR